MDKEPALIVAAVIAIFNVVALLVSIPDAVQAAISTAIIAIGAIWTRSKVYAPATVADQIGGV